MGGIEKRQITGFERGPVKLDTQEILEDACRAKYDKKCVSGDSELFYVSGSSQECKEADLMITGDSIDAIFIENVYETVCPSDGNCYFDKTKRLGSVCVADENTMKAIRANLGVKEPELPVRDTEQKKTVDVAPIKKNCSERRTKEETKELYLKTMDDLFSNPGFSEKLDKFDSEETSLFAKYIILASAVKCNSPELILKAAKTRIDEMYDAKMVKELKGVQKEHLKNIEPPSNPEEFHNNMQKKLDGLDQD